MAANFPTSLYSASSPASKRDTSLTRSEWLQIIDEVEAIEAALGANLANINAGRSGSVTLSGGTAAVLFASSEPDADYRIILSANGNENVWWASKATTGFAVTSSDPSSTSTVDWSITRAAS